MRKATSNTHNRLVAQWGAFFPFVDWHAHYKPFDIPGWVDFGIYGHMPLLAVVDPFCTQEQMEAYSKSALQVGLTYDILVLGAGITADESDPKFSRIGWLGEYSDYDEAAPPCHVFAPAVIGEWLPDKLGVCHEMNSWRDRISGEYTGWIPETPCWANYCWARAGELAVGLIA